MKRFEKYTKEDLWKLRKEIVLNSLFVHDYENSFGLDAHCVCDFFDGYASYLWDLVTEEHGHNSTGAMLDEYDNEENLWAWFNCFDNFSWIKYID